MLNLLTVLFCKMKISNVQQFETLVAELEKNPTLAKGFRRGTTPANFKLQWDDLSIKLNALGPPLRDGDGWQKVNKNYEIIDYIFKVQNVFSGLERPKV